MNILFCATPSPAFCNIRGNRNCTSAHLGYEVKFFFNREFFCQFLNVESQIYTFLPNLQFLERFHQASLNIDNAKITFVVENIKVKGHKYNFHSNPQIQNPDPRSPNSEYRFSLHRLHPDFCFHTKIFHPHNDNCIALSNTLTDDHLGAERFFDAYFS